MMPLVGRCNAPKPWVDLAGGDQGAQGTVAVVVFRAEQLALRCPR